MYLDKFPLDIHQYILKTCTEEKNDEKRNELCVCILQVKLVVNCIVNFYGELSLV